MNTLLAYVSDARAVVDWFHKVRGITIVKADNVLHLSELLKHSVFELVILDEGFLRQLDDQDLDAMGKSKVVILGEMPPESNWRNLNIIDHCSKPVQFNRLLKALTKVYKIRGGESVVRSSKGTILIKTDGVLIQLKLEEICCLESMRDYVLFHTHGHRFIVHTTLKNMQKIIDDVPEFIQIHRSFIVNSVKISKKTSTSVIVGNQTYPVSRTNRHKLKYLMVG